MACPPHTGPHVTAWAFTFSQITLSGFGGMDVWARLVLVERQHWLHPAAFLDIFRSSGACRDQRPQFSAAMVVAIVARPGWAGAAAVPDSWAGRASW